MSLRVLYESEGIFKAIFDEDVIVIIRRPLRVEDYAGQMRIVVSLRIEGGMPFGEIARNDFL